MDTGRDGLIVDLQIKHLLAPGNTLLLGLKETLDYQIARLDGSHAFKVIFTYRTKTNSNGEWRLEVPPGDYVLSVQANPGVASRGSIRNVASGSATMFTLSINAKVCKMEQEPSD